MGSIPASRTKSCQVLEISGHSDNLSFCYIALLQKAREMQSHLHRRGGIWWARLVVPAGLRQLAGRREFSQSCRTSELPTAKLVAAVLLCRWRQMLLALESRPMTIDVLKLVEGSPFLTESGWMSLANAEELSGVGTDELLQAAAEGKFGLYCRIGRVDGHVVPIGELGLQIAFITPRGQLVFRDSAPRIPCHRQLGSPCPPPFWEYRIKLFGFGGLNHLAKQRVGLTVNLALPATGSQY